MTARTAIISQQLPLMSRSPRVGRPGAAIGSAPTVWNLNSDSSLLRTNTTETPQRLEVAGGTDGHFQRTHRGAGRTHAHRMQPCPRTRPLASALDGGPLRLVRHRC